jgi:hypothetical protein
MARARKEETELTEETKKIGGWANGLRIVCNILKVFTIIGIVCLALVMLFLPAIMKEVKIDDEKIVLNGQKIEYSFKDVDFLTYRIDNGKEKTVNTKDIYKYTGLLDLGKIDMNKLRNIVMIDLGFVIVMCVLEFIILNKLSKLLKRTKDENVAFVTDGHKVLQNIMWIAIASEVIKMVMGLCTAIAMPKSNIETNISIDLMFVVAMCVLYFVSLLYKRGEQLQDK